MAFDDIGAVEKRAFLKKEIGILRQRAEKTGDTEALAILDFLEASPTDLSSPLEITLQTSACRAAASGLSEKEWMLELLSRHSDTRGMLEILWQALVDLRLIQGLPWPKEFCLIGPTRPEAIMKSELYPSNGGPPHRHSFGPRTHVVSDLPNKQHHFGSQRERSKNQSRSNGTF